VDAETLALDGVVVVGPAAAAGAGSDDLLVDRAARLADVAGQQVQDRRDQRRAGDPVNAAGG